VRGYLATLKERRLKRRLAGRRLLRAFARANRAAFFIEVGSNDGDQHDHLRPLIMSHGWTGVMVEPVPYVFERLRRNYGDVEGVALENAAIAERDGMMPFYHLAQVAEDERAQLPPWYDAIGSFSREALLGHADKIPDIERRVVTTEVPALTFESLCRKHGVEGLDLLLIDTEGYDWEIIKTIDFSVRQPRLLIYEHYHLPKEVRAQCRELLHGHGFETLEEGFDTWCLDTRVDDRLTRRWQGLRPALPTFSADENPA
jgi:FkbM family methyltransferase